MTVSAFQTKTSDRWSEQLTPWGVLDMALRGTRAQWWELYALARRDAEVRLLLRKMLPLADPDLCGGMRLWLALLDRFDAATQLPQP
jgi:hypothetical protein